MTTTLPPVTVMVDHVEPGCTLIQIRSAVLPTITFNGETFECGAFSIWRGRFAPHDWWITAEGCDIDARRTRTGAINAALKSVGIDRKASHVTIIEDTEY